jgi:hypothetical protein
MNELRSKNSELQDRLRNLIRQYTSVEAIGNQVFDRLTKGGTYLPNPNDPFTEYNVLTLVLLQELSSLKDDQMYARILHQYQQDLRKTIAGFGASMQGTIRYLVSTGVLISIVSFLVGFVLGKSFK